MNSPTTAPGSAGGFLVDLRTIVGSGWRRLITVGVLMLAGTALDVLGVVLIAPFLAITIQREGSIPILPSWLNHLVGSNPTEFGVLIFAVFVVKGYAAYRVQRSIALATEGERARLMTRLLAAYQAQPYESHLARNSSELINLVVLVTQSVTGGVLASLLQFVANALVFVALAVYLAITNLSALLILVVLLLSIFVGVARAIRPRLAASAENVAMLNRDAMHSVTQALGALREVRILGRENYFRDRLRVAADRLVLNSATLTSLHVVPRQAIEVAIVAFLVALVWLAHHEHTASLVPLLGTFGAAAARLMPASTALLSNWNSLRANRFAMRLLAHELATERALPPNTSNTRVDLPAAEAATVFEALLVDGVSYAYPGSRVESLSDVSLAITAGEVVGLMGRSGAGKSTLADLILGLLKPKSGAVRVNGWDINVQTTRWQRMVAYIPQTVYLLDDSLRRNIAFGVPDVEINDARVCEAVAQAQLTDLVAQLPHGLGTYVGERGVRLSGGQRQRVAIARALYHDRQFLILDEATSALDTETERSVVAAIVGLAGRKTMLVIAHRESTLAPCTRVLHLSAGALVERSSASLQDGPDPESADAP